MLLLLAGPPASGKDSISEMLTGRYGDYVEFQPLKVSPAIAPLGKYIAVSRQQFDAMRNANDLVYSVRRYGNEYGYDLQRLLHLAKEGRIVIVHLAGRDATLRFRELPVQMLVIMLWCSREVAESRLRERRPLSNLDERMKLWDQLTLECTHERGPWWDAAFRTDRFPVESLVAEIDRLTRSFGSCR